MSQKEENKLKPIFLVLTATLLFSIGAPISKITHSSPMVLTFFRCGSGLTVFIIYGLYTGSCRPFKIKPRLIIGGVLYAATSLSFYTALKFTTAANATILGNTSPFFIAILGFIFLQEKPLKQDWIILSIIMAGIVLCFFSGISFNGSKGDLLALAAGFFFSILAVIIKDAGPEDAIQPLIWGNLIAIIVTVPSLFIPDSVIPGNIPFFIVLGIFQMATPFILYAKGQAKMGTMEASLFKLLEPVAATVWVAILVSEIPSVLSIIGGSLVIAALFFKTFFAYIKTRK